VTPKRYGVRREGLILGFGGRQYLLFLGHEHFLNTNEDPSSITLQSATMPS
jgi:hypothetical protein